MFVSNTEIRHDLNILLHTVMTIKIIYKDLSTNSLPQTINLSDFMLNCSQKLCGTPLPPRPLISYEAVALC